MKNILIFKSSNLDFFDFKDIKKNHNLRLSAVLFNNAFQALSAEIKDVLDNIYILPDIPSSYRTLESFPEEALDSIIKSEVKLFPNTRLFSADEFNNLTVACLREKYGLPGTSYATILNFRDKFIQKRKLRRGGIKVPKFSSIKKSIHEQEIEIHYENFKYSLGLPFIIKPLKMFGTIGVEKIGSYNQFYDYLTKPSIFSDFIVEEFIGATLYHCDFLVQDNKYIFTEVCEYLHNGLSFLNGFNHGSLILTPDNPLRSSVINFCKKASSILGLKSGSGHFEVFVTKDQELIFLEAAARPAGSLVPLIFTKMFENNYMNAALLAEIEENPGSFSNPLQYYFWTLLPVKLGIVKSLYAPPIKSPYDIEWFVKIGDVLHKPCSIANKSGAVLVRNENYELLRTDFYSLKYFEAITIEQI